MKNTTTTVSPQIVTDLHTDDCNALRTRRQLERDAWIARYPRYCRPCNGFGGRETSGSLYEPPDFLQCTHCLDRHVCPRCGASGADPDAILYDNGPVCKVCGWVGNHDDDHLPFVPQCLCELSGNDDPLGLLEDYPY